MFRLTALLKARDGVTRAAFAARWNDGLGPLIVDEPGERLRKLIVNFPAAGLRPEILAMSGDRFDLLVEFWFDSDGDAVEALNQLTRSEPVVRAASQIIDAGSSVAWLSEVRPSKPDNGKTGVKFLAAGQVAEGWSVEDAQKYWEHEHPQLAQTLPEVWGPLTRYTQFHGRRMAFLGLENWLATERFVPLCADICFADQEDIQRHFTRESYVTIIRPDEEKFSRPGEMLAFLGGREIDLAENGAV
jgi:hypothetical protein